MHLVRRTLPRPRSQVFDLYWYFASARHLAFQRRLASQAPPWSEDEIIQKFKFCNVFRACDRVSQYLIRSVAYCEEESSLEDRVFQIIAFRVFSRIATWTKVQVFLGRTPLVRDLRDTAFIRALEYASQGDARLYTGAFILCAADAYGKKRKYLNHVELFRHMFVRERLGIKLTRAKSFRQIFELLKSYPLIGDFMAYQIAVDLNYSAHFNFSENEFTKAGPGAARGIHKVFEDLGEFTPEETIHWMVDHQEEQFARCELKFEGLWGRPLHAIDCQGLFCETDKYCREAMPELASARKRIKARFSVTDEPMVLFFPPKWKINSKIPTHPVLGRPQREGAPHPNYELELVQH